MVLQDGATFRRPCHWLLRVASASVHVNTLRYIKSRASENRQFVMSLERCCRRIDLLLDALLCECCKEDKDEETDLIDLTTWVLHQNCRQCRFVRYLLQKADNLDVPLRYKGNRRTNGFYDLKTPQTSGRPTRPILVQLLSIRQEPTVPIGFEHVGTGQKLS